ncbi:MAG TPA: cellulose binding domain-containing protein [Actinophytocola sp.]|uniref:cellulose binding domain-containing protein n=1 Tax=Actinophytocola sp. TaxID=1872138 RepID=UPI002DB9FF51|nr:cellulose binding domain-containing protein [Actinophytocola sp.]HEU5471512.1 cellulose binding domain-containing protein [Actinophytocola sp.]
MRKKALLSAVLTVLTVIAALLVVSPAPQAGAAGVKIMPLGDSITGSPGCWRALLWNRLQNTGHTNIDFVGTLGPQGCGVPYDGENEGHGGFLATNVANQNLLPGWLAATTPDIVLMHFGTNDVWNNLSPDTILAAFGRLVDQMRASKATMKILVAKIIPMNPSNCADCAQRVVNLNNAIPGWAASKSTAQSPITVVDQWTGFATGTDTGDGVHPNAAGDQKMSDRWYPALVAALGTVPPVTTTTTTTTTPGNPVPGCTVEIRVVNSWQGHFQIEIIVRNTGSTPINGWAARFTLAPGMSVDQSWNSVVSNSGQEVTVRNLNWNANIAPNNSTNVGMILSGNPAGWNPNPTC